MTTGTAPHGPASAAHPIMFWVLTLLALGVFAPCVLAPILIESQEIRAYERAAAGSLADLRAQVARNEARIEAIRSDPLVNDRIVRRELNYRPETEQVVHLPEELSRVHVALPPASQPSTGDEQGEWLTTAATWLPDWPWRELFAESPNRACLMTMSGGLLAAAFLLYGRPVTSCPRA